jgi:hypothetical protein
MLFDWFHSKKHSDQKSEKKPLRGFVGLDVILDELGQRVPRYLDEVDQGKHFTGNATADFTIAILAGLNWLTHCAQLSGVHPAKQSGTIRNFRKVVALAHRWWLTDGAAERCGELLASGRQPPLMLYLIWSDYTRLSKQIAAAAIFGSSINRSAKLVALPADLFPRFEAAQEPGDLLNT